jgi:hypothetical protein
MDTKNCPHYKTMCHRKGNPEFCICVCELEEQTKQSTVLIPSIVIPKTEPLLLIYER